MWTVALRADVAEYALRFGACESAVNLAESPDTPTYSPATTQLIDICLHGVGLRAPTDHNEESREVFVPHDVLSFLCRREITDEPVQWGVEVKDEPIQWGLEVKDVTRERSAKLEQRIAELEAMIEKLEAELAAQTARRRRR